MTMASAYATVAGGGQLLRAGAGRVRHRPGREVAAGADLQAAARRSTPTWPTASTKVLSTVLTAGHRCGHQLDGDRPAAGKTGTTDNNKQSWFAGYTPQLSTAVWVGTPTVQKQDAQPDPRRHSSTRRLRCHHRGADLEGHHGRRPRRGCPIRDFAEPERQGRSTATKVRGARTSAACPSPMPRGRSTDAGFSVSVGRRVYSNLSQGTIVYTSPGAGTKAMRGSDVTLNPSTGLRPPPPPAPAPGPATPPRRRKPTATPSQPRQPTPTPKSTRRRRQDKKTASRARSPRPAPSPDRGRRQRPHPARWGRCRRAGTLGRALSRRGPP